MRLLIFSDIHNDRRALARLMDIEADYYFAAGDMVTWAKGFDQIGPLLQRRAEKMYVIPGNHESESDVEAMCSRYGLTNLHGRTLDIAGFSVAGLGYSNPTPFNTPGEYSEEELAHRLQEFGELDPLILVCHCPPKDTLLDRVREGVHAGSTSVKDFIEQRQPRYFFCGHIHEAEGVTTRLGTTEAANVGKRGYLLDLQPVDLQPAG
jgi:Icc-related predicted phosphoesterase